MTFRTSGWSSDQRIYPNLFGDCVTMSISGLEWIANTADRQSLVLDVVDGHGRMILTSPVLLGEAVGCLWPA
ncbi:MAG: hypothetical protein SGJ05_01805 [bacterium]|nr:hypothetical protein [bacterium]